ncbi:ras-related and estrogen-regulated growth inhibitor [Macrosteles quadrilineatus]|uniref:ras-related and estrogen-regulated growth inhibitor n=1 Tax=Macrosteles quadrilineatus TaxID=74068 RepID=UPI0023E189E7|nr:ras-related and estrogen-regulated growth inhibitor [Macrosteles quadrilineatus]XP_054261751.1 ras-related and estrogen-regulated growth inhibitor [Macrosteles quadrilineatus]
MSTVSPPKSSPFCKIGLCSRHKPLKVMVLGQTGVGKTALVVRFITRRYIGEYDPTLEKVYTFHTVMDNEMVYFEILDTAGQPHESECLTLEANIRWAEAFILMYSVTDKCSFDECNRLKFLINYNKRKRRLNSSKESVTDVPVVLVGNKIDQWGDRMVTPEDGQRRSKEIGCVCFHEISVRESIEQVWTVFRDVCQFWKVHTKFPKLKRSSSDIHSPDAPPNGKPSLAMILGRRWTEVELDEEEETSPGSPTPAPEVEAELPPFRGRASTDGHLLSRPRRWRYPPPATTPTSRQADRRMSISMRGNNASC